MAERSGHVRVLLALAFAAAVLAGFPMPATAQEGVDADAAAVLAFLYEKAPKAKELAQRAKGILVFPTIVKAGFIIGAQYGEGTLLQDAQTAGHYNIVAASYGLQAGIQSFGYAMFFMTDSALRYLDRAAGLEIGAGPSIVLVDAGLAKTLTTTTAKSDVYSFVFGQRGLMAGGGLQGSKITRSGESLSDLAIQAPP